MVKTKDSKQMKDLESRIIQLLEEETGLSDKITLKAKLHHDLDMWGDSVIWVLETLGKEYKIDFSDFDFDKYFMQETNWYFYYRLLRKILGIKKVPARTPVTVSHLVEVVRRKKWFDPAGEKQAA